MSKSFIITCGTIQGEVVSAETSGDAIRATLLEHWHSRGCKLGHLIQIDNSEFPEPLIGLTYDYLKDVIDDVDKVVPKYVRTWDTLSKHIKKNKRKNR